MEEVRSAIDAHMDQMADLVQKLTAELRSGLGPAYDNFLGFFHAIDWKEPWLMCLLSFHVVLLIVVVISRKNVNFQMCLFLLACLIYISETGQYFNALPKGGSQISKCICGIHDYLYFFISFIILLSVLIVVPGTANTYLLGGVYFAESLNKILERNWKSFATQNYFDHYGVFLSVLWSGPLLVIAIIILVNTLLSLCYLIVKWKRAELKHRARLSHNKED